MEPRNFLPWILSAMVHSVIIYGLYGMHGALDLDAPGGEDGNDGDGDDGDGDGDDGVGDGDGDDDGGDGDGDGSVITLTAGWCRHEEERAELNSYISFDDYNDSHDDDYNDNHDDDYNDNHDLIVMMLMIVNVHVMMM